MSDDTTIDRYSIRHAYEQVADAVAARIETGRYLGKLPAELVLARSSACPISPSGTRWRYSANAV